MAKRTKTTDVFDKLTENDEPDESVDGQPAAEADADSGTAIDEQDGETPAVDQGGETAAPPESSPSRRRVLSTVAGVALVGALALLAVLGWRVKKLDDTAAAARSALAAARSYAITLTTLDATDIDTNYRQVLDGATGEFKDEYSQGSAQLRQVLIDNKAASQGIVIDAAVKSAAKTEVEVLLFVDQSVTNAVNPALPTWWGSGVTDSDRVGD